MSSLEEDIPTTAAQYCKLAALLVDREGNIPKESGSSPFAEFNPADASPNDQSSSSGDDDVYDDIEKKDRTAFLLGFYDMDL